MTDRVYEVSLDGEVNVMAVLTRRELLAFFEDLAVNRKADALDAIDRGDPFQVRGMSVQKKRRLSAWVREGWSAFKAQ